MASLFKAEHGLADDRISYLSGSGAPTGTLAADAGDGSRWADIATGDVYIKFGGVWAVPSSSSSGSLDQVFNTSALTTKTTSDAATLGAELTTNGTFTGDATGWTLGTNWAYGTNNVILTLGAAVEGTLSQDITVTSGSSYLIEWSQTNSVADAGTIKPSIGTANGFYVGPTSTTTSTMSQIVVAAESGTVSLSFNVLEYLAGTLTIDSITVKEITKITPAVVITDVAGGNQYETRIAKSASGNNLVSGLDAGYCITTGYYNVVTGGYSGQNITTGNSNSFYGLSSGKYNTSGTHNCFFGVSAGRFNTTGRYNNCYGAQAGRLTTTGYGNNFFGYQSGYSNTTGFYNIAIGHNAGYNNTVGTESCYIGANAGSSNIDGYSNNFIGASAGFYNVEGYANNFFGVNAGANNTRGDYNTLLGNGAGRSVTTVVVGFGTITPGSGYTNGTYNNVQLTYLSGSTAITYPTANITVSGGVVTACTLVTGGSGIKDYTTILTAPAASIGGTGSGFSIPIISLGTGQYNVMVGHQAGYTTTVANATTSAQYCTFVGHNSGAGSTTQNDYATAIGSYAKVTTANTVVLGRTTDVTVIGATGDDSSGSKLQVTGNISLTKRLVLSDTNISLGNTSVLGTITTGNYNCGIGNNSLFSNTVGTDNVAIGNSSQYYMRGSRNFAAGPQALYGSTVAANNTGTDNIAIGDRALYYTTNGSSNVALGVQSQYLMRGAANVGVGQYALYGYANPTLATGSENVSIGSYTLYNLQSGSKNIAIGERALFNNSIASNTVSLGYQSLYKKTAGDYCVSVGYQAGYTGVNASNGTNNTFIGTSSGVTDTADTAGSSYSTAIGSDAKINVTGSGSYTTALGAGAYATTANTVVLGRTTDATVIGATGDDSSGAKLQVTGNVKATGALTLGTALTTANGGTGITSPGAVGNILSSNGTSWVSSPSISGGAVSTKVGTFTRDISAASGNVSYTGIGFTPKLLIISWLLNGQKQAGDVTWDANNHASGTTGRAFTDNWWTTDVIDCYPTAGGRHHGDLVSFDADGFTLSWTKTSTPTGTISVVYTAISQSTAAGVREILTADRTYYVATTGNDTNTGRTVGAPLLTIQKAVDIVSLLDCGSFNITIQLADGTYTGATVLKSFIGTGTVTIQGNNSTPSNVLVNVTSASAFNAVSTVGIYIIKALKVQTNTSGFGIGSNNTPSFIRVDNVVFGDCASGHMTAQSGGRIVVSTNYSITGSAPYHIFVVQLSTFICNTKTITITGTPNFSSSFAACDSLAFIYIGACTFSGSATGTRYSSMLNSLINTVGGGATYLPGSVAGSTTTGGLYV